VDPGGGPGTWAERLSGASGLELAAGGSGLRARERRESAARVVSERSVDANYELPVPYEVTRAWVSDIARAQRLLGRLKERRGGVVAGCEVLVADKGYDSGSFVAGLWDAPGLRIKPVVAIRDCWQDGEATRLVSGQRNVVYDYHKGTSTATAP